MSLWQYARRAWLDGAVRTACIDLQNVHGQCASLLLWRMWAVARRRAVDARALERAILAARAWETGVVGPLRVARGALDASADNRLDFIDDVARLTLRARVLAAEIAAERALLRALEPLAATVGAREDAKAALVEVAARWGGAAPPELLAPLAAFVSAAGKSHVRG